jgi:hypothetical protein
MNPNQLRQDDGFATFITFANIPTIKFYEKEVTPPGFSAGGPIDTTTMRNTALRTAAPRKLKTVTQIKATVAYATVAIDDARDQIGVNQLVTIHYPDGATMALWGWLEEFMPSNHAEGAQPTATITVHPSNRDDTGAEFTPVYTAPVTSS